MKGIKDCGRLRRILPKRPRTANYRAHKVEVAVCLNNPSIEGVRDVLYNQEACFFFSGLCWGKAMVAYTMPQQWKKEESNG